MARESFFRSATGRWLSIGLRALHLAGVAWLAAVVLGAPHTGHAAGVFALTTGALLFAADLAAARIGLFELAGGWVLIKLALVGCMLLVPAYATWLFFGVLLVSALTSHAPRPARHWSPWSVAPDRRGAVTGGSAAPADPDSQLR